MDCPVVWLYASAPGFSGARYSEDQVFRECHGARPDPNALHGAGVTIIPGADALAGYTLRHELELYVRAGIAPADVLRMTTLTPAQVMGVDKDRGVIAPGKLADMILVGGGDPRRTSWRSAIVSGVVKGGKIYDPAAIETVLGIAARPQK